MLKEQCPDVESVVLQPDELLSFARAVGIQSMPFVVITEPTVLANIMGLLDHTKKALEIVVEKVKALKELADIAGFGMFSAGCQDIIEQITALEQKDK